MTEATKPTRLPSPENTAALASTHYPVRPDEEIDWGCQLFDSDGFEHRLIQLGGIQVVTRISFAFAVWDRSTGRLANTDAQAGDGYCISNTPMSDEERGKRRDAALERLRQPHEATISDIGTKYSLSHITDLSQLSDADAKTFADEFPTLLATLRIAQRSAKDMGVNLVDSMPHLTFAPGIGDKVVLRGAQTTEHLGAHVVDADKAQAREAAEARYKLAGGDPIQIAKLEAENDANNAKWALKRVFDAVLVGMGLAAPRLGTQKYQELYLRVTQAIQATSLEREELFSPELRQALQEAYFQNENDSGSFGKSWRKQVLIHGKQPLNDETDAALLERVLTNVSIGYLRDDESGKWLGPEHEFLEALRMLPKAVEVVHRVFTGELDPDHELLDAISDDLTALGVVNPYLDMQPNESSANESSKP